MPENKNSKTMREITDERRQRWEFLRTVRRGHETAWQEIYDLMWPFRGDITTIRSEGADRIFSLHDTTAATAAQSFMNFMMAMVFPSNADWMRMLDEQDDPRVMLLLDSATQDMLRMAADSNFYVEMAQAMFDYILIGNSAFTGQEKAPKLRNDPTNTFGGMFFKGVPMWDVWWSFGEDGDIETMIRRYRMHAVNAYRFFRGNPGSETKRKLTDSGAMSEVCYLQFVYPNENWIPGGLRAKTDKRWVSEFFEVASNDEFQLVRLGGFDVNPFVGSRWHVVGGETYARGRGHDARPDAKTINELTRQTLNAANWALDPPLITLDDSTLQFDAGPGGEIVMREPSAFVPKPLQLQSDFNAAQLIRDYEQAQIRNIFLSDVVQPPDTQPRSAEAVLQQRAQRFLSIAVSANNMLNNLMRPTVKMMGETMRAAGALQQLDEVERITGEPYEFRVQFLAPLFTAQKELIRAKMNGYVRERIEIAGLAQDGRYAERLNPDAIAKKDAELADVPEEIFYTDEELLQIRQQRQALQRQLIEAQQQQQTAEIGKTVSETQKNRAEATPSIL